MLSIHRFFMLLSYFLSFFSYPPDTLIFAPGATLKTLFM